MPSDDPLDESRTCVSGTGPGSIFRLMPVDHWARKDTRGDAQATPEADEASAILAKLPLALPVAGFAYPAGCRIRRVRGTAPRSDLGPVIVSRRTLEELHG